MFDERRSLIFKSLQVVRFFDAKRNVIVYVAYSDRVMTGSPQELDLDRAADALGHRRGEDDVSDGVGERSDI